MSRIFFSLVFTALLSAGCGNVNSHQLSNGNLSSETTCTDWQCIEVNKNKEVIIKGLFRKYTPNETGKGAGHMFWEWEVMLNDGHAVPAQAKDKDLDLSGFVDKTVTVKGFLFHGIVIGSDEPHAQNATGYRIDIESIKGR